MSTFFFCPHWGSAVDFCPTFLIFALLAAPCFALHTAGRPTLGLVVLRSERKRFLGGIVYLPGPLLYALS